MDIGDPELAKTTNDEWNAFRDEYLEYKDVFMPSYIKGLGGKYEVIQLAGGEEVPVYLVEALDELAREWPGSTLSQARPAIVAKILKAQRRT